MQLVLIVLTSSAPQEGPSAERLVELLARHTYDSEQLQHVRVRAGPRRYDIGLFLVAATQQLACDVARSICERALQHEKCLHGWSVTPC